MKKNYDEMDIKDNRFPPSLFAIFLGVLLLMAGVHTGLIMLMNEIHASKFIQVIVPMAYWSVVAVGLTLFTRQRIKHTYEEPLHELANASRKVAEGDFSVYMSTSHTTDKLDYLDVMILDFNSMVEELGSIETLKTDFVSNVSHEMKTPIAIIKNYAELLERKLLSEEERIEYSKNIEEAAARLSNLISNILKLNKLENQKILPQMEKYTLCGQMEECILQFENTWEEKNIEIDIELEETAVIEADKGLMELVWNNLLSNAMKYTEPGGSVRVSQKIEEGFIKTAISDTGCGMSKESMKRIFDKFYQADTSHSGEGNGLGLALALRVIDLMNGDIQVESELGKGSTFTVALPLSNEKEREEV